MKRAFTLSIRSKLTLIVMTTVGAALCLAIVALVVFDQLSFSARLQQGAVMSAQIIANSSREALSLRDARAARKNLLALSADPHLVAATIYDGDGRAFARFIRAGWKTPLPETWSGNEITFDREFLAVSQPVVMNRRRLGTVLLQADFGGLRERRRNDAWVGGGVLLLALGVGYGLAMRLQRVISQPIQELAQASRTIAANKNYAVRVPKHAEDELGQLVDGYNEMLAQIEARDAALQQTHAELENRVRDRTRELFEANRSLRNEVSAHRQAQEESDALRARLQLAYENLSREAEERIVVQEALSRSEERFSKAFRASPVPLAILTRGGGTFMDVNDRFTELVGQQRGEIVGSTLFSLPLWNVPETRARIEQLLAEGHPLRNWECRIAGAGKESRAALLSAESFSLGSEACVLLMTEDISERMNLEGQLRQVQKMDAIGQLAAGVAHDFNNLLTIIQGYTQMVLVMQTPGAGVIRDALEKVISATKRAGQLTGQLLTFSRKQVAQPKSLDLNQIVTNVAAMLQPLLGENVRLTWSPAASLPTIMGDSGMVEQLLVNLAVNARDAMVRGGDLLVSTFTCEIDASYLQARPQAGAGRFVCLQVADSGCGMDAETRERIFEPFFTTKSVGKGTGLGLATVYGIVKQHRGWVEVASQVGVGTTFKIFLPAAKTAATATESDEDHERIRGGNETIFVVEDEPAVRELVSRILRTYGYQIVEAAYGKEALNLWERTSPKPAMLLTDMMMPEGMTGWELAERLRVETPDLRVVYTSGYSPELFGGEVKLKDRANFLPKPFHPRALAKTVRHCLDN